VVADLHFESGTDDPDNDLFDGIDLLWLAQKKRPSTRRYVLSFWADQEHYRQRTAAVGLTIDRWLPKTFFLPAEDRLPPWQVIEPDLIKARLRTARPAGTRDDLSGEPDNLASQVQHSILPPMRTFLQSLGEKSRNTLKVVKPIEVICFQGEEVRASA